MKSFVEGKQQINCLFRILVNREDSKNLPPDMNDQYSIHCFGRAQTGMRLDYDTKNKRRMNEGNIPLSFIMFISAMPKQGL